MASLLTGFTAEWLFTLAAVATLAWVGLPFTLPFRNDQRFTLLLAPMLGLITLPMAVAAVYIFARTSLRSSALGALALMSIVSIVVAVRRRPVRRSDLPILALVLIVSAVATVLCSTAAIQSGTANITFIDGSDQAGYGHPADWLINNGVARRPIVSPDVPYESWAQLVLSLDPRLSSFVFVALIAMARGVSGLFAYDAACAIVGTVGPMAVAAVFARTRSTLFLLTLALMTSALFDLGRSGYLGKIAGYPGALMLAGLFMTSTQRHMPWLATVIALTVGVAALHSGAATAFLLLMIGVTFLIARFLLNFRDGEAPRFFLNDGILLLLLMFIAVAASGVLARPVGYPPGDALPFGWGWLIDRFFEIENAQTDRVRALLPWLTVILQIAVALQLAAIAVALLAGNPLATALCASPMVMLAALYVADMKWIALQIFSVLTCCTLAGIAVLHDDLRIAGRKSAQLAILMLGLAFVAIRLPRFAVAVDRYAFRTDPQYRYGALQFSEIRRLVDQGTLEIDTEEPLPLFAALNELGSGGIKLQWSERAWKRAFWYRRWPRPSYPGGPDFRLTAQGDQPSAGSLILQTPQYRLWRLPQAPGK